MLTKNREAIFFYLWRKRGFASIIAWQLSHRRPAPCLNISTPLTSGAKSKLTAVLSVIQVIERILHKLESFLFFWPRCKILCCMYMKRFLRSLESSTISHAASNSSDGRAVLPQKQLPEAKSYINLLSFLQMDAPSPPPPPIPFTGNKRPAPERIRINNLFHGRPRWA